ncbi:MAG: hypothetical protein RLZZ587_1066, partial [Actinomycetota bacterium]
MSRRIGRHERFGHTSVSARAEAFGGRQFCRYSFAEMSDKYTGLLEQLRASDEWLPAATLAERLGVSTRSVRSYVTAAKSAAHPFDIIATSSAGYRLNRDAYFAYRAA